MAKKNDPTPKVILTLIIALATVALVILVISAMGLAAAYGSI